MFADEQRWPPQRHSHGILVNGFGSRFGVRRQGGTAIGPRLEQSGRWRVGKLSGHRGGVPVLPGFDEAAVLDANYGDAGDLSIFAGGFVDAGDGPAEADQVIFGKGNALLDVNIVELCADAVVEVSKFLRAANGSVAFVEDALGGEEIEDGFAAGLIPDLIEPALHQLFVVIEDGSGRGGHSGASCGKICGSIQP